MSTSTPHQQQVRPGSISAAGGGPFLTSQAQQQMAAGPQQQPLGPSGGRVIYNAPMSSLKGHHQPQVMAGYHHQQQQYAHQHPYSVQHQQQMAQQLEGGGPVMVNNFEQTWLKVGVLAMSMEEWDRAVGAFEAALKHNPSSVQAYYLLASCLHQQQQFVQAIEVYQRLLGLIQSLWASSSGARQDLAGLKGEIWASIGHCALILDDLARAFSAFQQALQILGSPRNASIWFAIGLLYDRYGADELAREAFLITLRYEREASAATPGAVSQREREIYYRLGMVYMNLKKWDLSKECFAFSAKHPPNGLGQDDVYFYIGVLYSIQGKVDEGRVVFERICGKVGEESPTASASSSASEAPRCSRLIRSRSKCILGWYEALCNGPEAVPRAIGIVQAAMDEDTSDAFAWYCKGRIHMLARDFTKAYDAYQQAVYRDGTNACFWNSIGILYHEIGQFRDALDAYSRSIHLAPFVADTWWNLGVLYEVAHKQYDDAVDAYNRAAELDPGCARIISHLAALKALNGAAHATSAEAPQPQLAPVEYCPMPFFSRPVILGAPGIPPQRPALSSQNHPTANAPIGVPSQIPIGPQQQQQDYQKTTNGPQPMQAASILQQSRAAQPMTFARANPIAPGPQNAFALPHPNAAGGFAHPSQARPPYVNAGYPQQQQQQQHQQQQAMPQQHQQTKYPAPPRPTVGRPPSAAPSTRPC